MSGLKHPGQQRSIRAQAGPYDQSWLDERLLSWPGSKQVRAAVKRYIQQLPVRAQRVIFKAVRGELWGVAPVTTMREFLTVPTKRLLLTKNYSYRTHLELCRTLRGLGITDTLFSGDEDNLPKHSALFH